MCPSLTPCGVCVAGVDRTWRARARMWVGLGNGNMLRDTASSRLLLLLHACACACGVVAVARVARLDVRRAEFRAGAGARDRRHRDADRVDGSKGTPTAAPAAANRARAENFTKTKK